MAKKIFSQNPEKYVLALASVLKEYKEFKAPEWSYFVKSSTSKQRPPVQEDFWYIRSASILRQLYIKGVVGVGKLRTRYGSRKKRGGRPEEFRKSGGKIIRTILQQAENAGLVEKVLKLQFGRRLTKKGRDLLDSIDIEATKNLDITNLTTDWKKELETNIEEEDRNEINEEEQEE